MIQRLFAVALVSLFAVFGAAPALAQATIEGEWNVVYFDLELGPVTGTAIIENGRATVELRNPAYGETNVLTARNIAVEGDTVTMVLEGLSPLPGGLPDGLADPALPIVTDRNGGTLVVSRGENRVEHTVEPRNETDIDRVMLELTLSKDGNALDGRWSYRVDRYLETDVRGLGRRGNITERDGVLFAGGFETWTRPKVVVYGAVVLQDQLSLTAFSDGTTSADYGYPWAEGVDSEQDTRWVFVFGRDLPRTYKRSLEISAIDPGVSYVEKDRAIDGDSSADARALFDEGWEKVRNQLRAIGKQDREIDSELAGLSAIILRADLTQEAVPGYQSLSIDGSETAWPLQYGDNTGTLRFVRRIGPNAFDFERVHYAFVGERVMVELRTNVELPVAEIPLIIGRNGEPVLTGDVGGPRVLAIRTADDAKLYRTELIQIDPWIGPGNGAMADGNTPWHRIGAGQGDQLMAIVAQPGLLSIAPDMAQVTAYETPTDTAVGGNWADFLATAADCAGVAPTGGVATETAGAGAIDEFLINSGRSRIPIPGWMETKVTVGQHAAMLMLRDTYLQLMRRNEVQLRRIESNRDIALYRRSIENLVRQQLHPLSRIEVTGPDGNKTEFVWTFEGDIVAQVTGVGRATVDDWAIAATREALEIQRTLMREKIAETEAIEDCELEPLLRLTGYGFEPIAQIAMSKLMRRGPAPQFWVPDTRPRAQIETVAYVADTLEIQDRLGTEDTREALMAVGFASIPVAIGGGIVGSGAAATAVALVDVTDISYSVYSTLDEKWRSDQEIAFALASAEIMGMQRLQRAEANRVTWTHVFVDTLFTAGPAVIGLGFDAPEIFKAFREGMTLRRVARGEILLQAMNAAGDAGAAAAQRAAANDTALVRILQNAAAEPPPAAAVGAVGDAPTTTGLTGDAPTTPGAAAPAERAPTTATGEAADLRPVDASAEPPAVLRDPRSEPPLRLDADAIADVARRSGDDLLAALDNMDPAQLERAIDDAGIFRGADIVAGRNRPGWADAFDPADYERLRPLLVREDLLRLMDEAAQTVAAALRQADPLQREYAWRLIEFEPGLTAQGFGQRLNRLVEEAPQMRGKDYFLQAAPNDVDINEALRRAGWDLDTKPDGAGFWGIRDPDGNYGTLARDYDAGTGLATFSVAYRKWGNSPGRIAGTMQNVARVPAFGNKIIAMEFFQMRVLHSLGVRFAARAGTDGTISRVLMEHIANPATLVTVNWWKRTYFPNVAWADIPADRIQALLMATHSVDYARRTVASMGYRVNGARMVFDSLTSHTGPLGHMGGDFESRFETWAELLARHGIDPDTPTTRYFSIELDVEPW